ncbi:hypothetical protein Tco_0438022 [Tanacetum coccineum]
MFAYMSRLKDHGQGNTGTSKARLVVRVLKNLSVGFKAVTIARFKAVTTARFKIDRLILELKLTPLEAYARLLRIVHEINGIVSAYKSEKKISEVKEILMVDSITFGQEMVNILDSEKEYDKVFNHLDMLNAPLKDFTTAKYKGDLKLRGRLESVSFMEDQI